MNILLIIWLLSPGIIYGAASMSTLIEGEDAQLIPLFRKSLDETGMRAIVARTLSLEKKDVCAGIVLRELRQQSHNKNMPWIVCDFEAHKHLDLLKILKPKQGFFDPLALLQKRTKRKRSIDLTTFDTLSATISKEFERKSKYRLSVLGMHILDREKMIGFADEVNTQSYVYAQLKYSLDGDFEALRRMITLYSRRKFNVKDPEKRASRDMVGETYIAAWCATYLAQYPNDEEVRAIMMSHQMSFSEETAKIA